MTAVTICSDFGAQENKICPCFHFSPICYEVMGPDVMIFVLWMLNFQMAFLLSSFTLNRLFSSSSLFAIRVVSSAYMRLLTFLPAILIPVCDSSSLAFHMMYSAYKSSAAELMHGSFPLETKSTVLVWITELSQTCQTLITMYRYGCIIISTGSMTTIQRRTFYRKNT